MTPADLTVIVTCFMAVMMCIVSMRNAKLLSDMKKNADERLALAKEEVENVFRLKETVDALTKNYSESITRLARFSSALEKDIKVLKRYALELSREVWPGGPESDMPELILAQGESSNSQPSSSR